MTSPRTAALPLAGALGSGVAAAAGQAALARELLSLFSGFELALGLFFAGWLLWTALGSAGAGVLVRRAGGGSGAALGRLSLGLSALALALPGSLVLARLARTLWGLPLGEMPPLPAMAGIALGVTAPFCLACGAVFALAWAVLEEGGRSRTETSARSPVRVYLAESLGAGLGGLGFYFLVTPLAPDPSRAVPGNPLALLAGLLCLSLVLSGLALWTALAGRRAARGAPPAPCLPTVLAALAVVLVAGAFLVRQEVESATLKARWGPDLAATAQTPGQALALFRRGELFTLMAGGVWLYSVPDLQSAQWAAHLPLLLHPDPRQVLLVGGDPFALGREALRHPGVDLVEHVDPDPWVLGFARAHLPAGHFQAPRGADADPGSDLGVGLRTGLRPGLHLIHEDAAVFLRRTLKRYDAVLFQLGDPVNASLNRFYTLELFRAVRTALRPGGLFSLAVSSSPEAVGPAQAALLATVRATLAQVFAQVLVIPGDQARFVASDRPVGHGDLLATARSAVAARGLDLAHLDDSVLADLLSPWRLASLDAVLDSGPAPEINRDFRPVCAFNGLVLGSLALHPGIKEAYLGLREAGAGWGWAGGAALAGLLALAGRASGGRASEAVLRRAVGLAVAVMGGLLMGLEVVLLLGFQILAGDLYSGLALVVAASMAGLGLGAAWAARPGCGVRPGVDPVRGLVARIGLAQAGVVVLALAALPLLQGMSASAWARGGGFWGGSGACTLAFCLLNGAAGVLGGAHFGLSARVSAGLCAGTRSASAGARLYALDLAGAMLGSLAVSLVFVPVYGFAEALGLLALAGAGSLAGLAWARG